MPQFSLKRVPRASGLELSLFARIIQLLQILPRTLYLYLNPLYSTRGGSTMRAEPFTKKPTEVARRWKPLYRWKILSHRTFVLSLTNNHVAFCNMYTLLKKPAKFYNTRRPPPRTVVVRHYWHSFTNQLRESQNCAFVGPIHGNSTAQTIRTNKGVPVMLLRGVRIVRYDSGATA